MAYKLAEPLDVEMATLHLALDLADGEMKERDYYREEWGWDGERFDTLYPRIEQRAALIEAGKISPAQLS